MAQISRLDDCAMNNMVYIATSIASICVSEVASIVTLSMSHRHYKIFCVNGNTGFRNESRIFYFIHLQNEKDYERKKSSSA